MPRTLASLIALTFAVQSLAAADPCRCDMGSAPEQMAEDHSCCPGGGHHGDNAPVQEGASCPHSDDCGCMTLSVLGAEERAGGVSAEPIALVHAAPAPSTAPLFATSLVRVPPPRWPPPLRGARFASLQVWRC